jgi:hypothetical protein
MLLAPLYQSTDLGNACRGTRAILQGNEVVQSLAGSKCVLLGHICLRDEELLVHVQIHDTGNDHFHVEEGAVHSLFAKDTRHVHLWAVTNMFKEDMWIFADLDPADDYRRDLCRITNGSHIEK